MNLGKQPRAGVIIALKKTLNAFVFCQMNFTFEQRKKVD
jgi:hypothetical protein